MKSGNTLVQIMEEAVGNQAMSTAQKIELAQWAFSQFYTRCFWFMREDLEVREENLESIVRGLRSHGNREAFLIAAKLCR